ncbi:hypothetical protein FBU31_000159 [Coemansia sp. 'formosensis']|nr:hypothetical protein FBU31_000159 [Coemansia sp. 'formosensis']
MRAGRLAHGCVLLLLSALFAACLLYAVPALGCSACPVAAKIDASSDLFGRCPLFDRVVKDQMLSGSITAEEAFAELDSHNCPIIRGASITSPEQLKVAAEHSAKIEAAGGCPFLAQRDAGLHPVARNASPPGQSMADECRRISDLLYTIDESDNSATTTKAATLVMDQLCNTKVPLINNCPLFQGVKARYQSNVITAQMGVGEMKANCPILSKELNPAMLFNFEEYGSHRDEHYDAAHASHDHPAGCCCAASSSKASHKQLYKRHDEHEEPGMCLPGGKTSCNHEQIFAKSAGKVSGLERLLGGVFPKGNPAAASMLATFYISLFPNLVLFATPTSIPNKALRIMVSFAVGGLLGDVFLHLLPHMFAGEHGHDHHHHGDHDHGNNVSEHVRNTVYGCAIFIGLIMFFVVDKFMRLLGSGHSHGSHSHGHGHSHSMGHSHKLSGGGSGDLSGSDSKQLKLRKRRASAKGGAKALGDDNEADDEKDIEDAVAALNKKESKRPVKLSAYLNLIADAAHNFTDGLAMSASFYLSHAAGLSTFVAVFFHEIPHELGDFAILVQSGFSRSSALASQFFTALGAIAGTIAGIMIEESGKGNSFNFRGLFTPGVPVFSAPVPGTEGSSILPAVIGGALSLLPSTVAGVPWSKLVIPFTAGGFIYVGTVSVLPDLLQPDEEETDATKGRSLRPSDKQNTKKGITMALVELGAMFVGLGIMAIIALSEE